MTPSEGPEGIPSDINALSEGPGGSTSLLSDVNDGSEGPGGLIVSLLTLMTVMRVQEVFLLLSDINDGYEGQGGSLSDINDSY